MKNRLFWSCTVALSLFTIANSAPAFADVKSREKGQVQFEGMLGTMMRMFGGKAASEGIVSSNAVKGDRKATFNDTTGLIVDLAEQKVYKLDMKKKTYTVVTFDELRRQLQEARDKAAKESKESPKEGNEPAQQPSGKEIEFEFSVKETGQTKSIAGYDTREVIMTLTGHEKGKTLDESGGMVVTADSWIGPEIPALKELAEFEMKYWKAIAPETATISAEQMAAVTAMYPMVKQAMERMNQEKVNMKGTPLATTVTFEGVKSKEQMSQQQQSQSGGGLSGMLARKMMKKGEEKPRATIFTMTTETLEVGTSVAPADLSVPEGFKQKN